MPLCLSHPLEDGSVCRLHLLPHNRYYQNLLDESKGRPLKSLYHDFNIMCRELNSVQQYLQIIAEESERLAELSKNQLFLSNLESKQIVQNRIFYSLDEQIRHCVIMLSNQ